MNSSEVIRRLKAAGWQEIRIRGSHHQFKHRDARLVITVPHPRKDLPLGTAQGILRCAGLK